MVRILRRAFTFASWGVSVVASVLAISSYFAYTTAGFDFETETASGIDVCYYRLRWDDGSTWVGQAVQPGSQPKRPLDWFDPGGTLFAKPTRPVHRSRWNDLGFWHVTTPADDPYVLPRYFGATSSSWWGCPSWLVVAGLWGWPIGRVARRRWASRSR